ncbi:tyrosine-type recombinase/integrase [Gimesia aquarii]|uniref:Phage integrase family protein n=1 Tax=Gimesia aquarii TaxID=2527964 RepID=A0A517VYC6_9PLAN|nr:tyrosine-type recombinase/integrase [Gimesia aquarii]QDT98008.1 Phage integrase family protein [Gimesia aquarii]
MQLEKDQIFWSVYKDMYLQRLQIRDNNQVYIDNVRRVLERFTRYCNLVTRFLSEITVQDLEHYLKIRKGEKCRGKLLSNVTLNNDLQALNSCLGAAGPIEPRGPGRGNYGFLDFPPYIEMLSVDETEPKVVTEQQIQKFSEAASFARSPQIEGCTPAEFWRAALLLGMITGLRRRGLLLIERPSDEMLIEKRELFLSAKHHKTRNSLRIPLGSAEVVNMLAKLPSQKGEPLLPWRRSTGEPLSAQHFSNTMAKIQREAGIAEGDRVKTKNLRSTTATIIAEEFNDDLARKRLGHSPNSKSTLLVNYKAKRVSDLDRVASEKLGELVLPHVTSPILKVFGT